MLGFEVGYHGQHFTGWHRQGAATDSLQAVLELAVERTLGEAQPQVKLNALAEVATAKGAHARGQLLFFRATPAALAFASGNLGLSAAAAAAGDVPKPGAALPLVVGPLRQLGQSWPRPPRQLRVRYYFQQGQPVPSLAPPPTSGPLSPLGPLAHSSRRAATSSPSAGNSEHVA